LEGRLNLELRTLDEITEDTSEWLVDKLVCPWITLVSGQPKYGKSALIGHISMALINGTDFLGRKTKPGNHKIAWMGYDSGWKQELKTRWHHQSANRLLTINPIRTNNVNDWFALANLLVQNNITLFVIDHLLGLADVESLNDSDRVQAAMNLIKPICDDFGIPILLIHQAGKSEWNKGRAANSNAIEANARCLIRITDKQSNDVKKIHVISNFTEDQKFSLKLNDLEVNLVDKPTKNNSNSKERISPEVANKLLKGANPKEMNSWSGAGRELARLNYSENPNAGRTMAKRLGKQNLLKLQNGQVVAGDSLIVTALYYKDEDVASD
jgi:hypothetical protein